MNASHTESAGASMLRLHIERMSYGPDALAHDPCGKTIFVSGAVPGDVVEAKLTHEGKSFSRATTLRVLEPSEHRVHSPCPLADICGGCPWATYARKEQLSSKRNNLIDALVRIGDFTPDEAEGLVAPIQSPGSDWGYRNKLELGFSRKGKRSYIGMYGKDPTQLVRLESCPLFSAGCEKDKRLSKLPKALSGALAYLANSHALDFERIGIRSSLRTGDLELALWTQPTAFPRAQAVRVLKDVSHFSSIVRVMTKGPRKARRIAGVEALQGKGFWSEQIGNERMYVSAPSFFQVNTQAAERLVELVVEALRPEAHERILDLYCGAGTFTLPLARHCGELLAVEAYGPAVRDLRRNLKTAGIDNVEAIGGDAAREFPPDTVDAIVVDPPRAGLARPVIEQLASSPAQRCVYVSCDPATLARDLARLRHTNSFRIDSLIPVDLFPQTFHVETVALMTRSRA